MKWINWVRLVLNFSGIVIAATSLLSQISNPRTQANAKCVEVVRRTPS
jgi:hypothetical protein